ncbi:MAG: iron transporter [Planctomycetota bacterium]|nr:MAG: iron transporter [Planctomycetota bacterium]
MKPRRLLHIIGPGILVAATGVGAGDLATASFTGSVLGLAILWAVLLGALMKFVLNEGLTRWQLATGTTLIEGCVEHFGRPARWAFLGYLVFWSFFVGAALMSAVGVTAHAIFPLTGTEPQDASTDKIVYGVLHSALAVVLVQVGGYRLFEKVMSVCISLMFLVVVVSAIALGPDLGGLLRGLLVPVIPAGGTAWTVALIGGVGGTVTVLCYGYWIREEGRLTTDDLATCRIDLATGYLMTAVFGVAMVIIGGTLGQLEGSGATLVVEMARTLETALGRAGPFAKWAFLIGAWAAVFSSLLGVWQSIPYLFADLWNLMRGASPQRTTIDTRSLPYRGYLYALAIVPVAGMTTGFQAMQKAYAIVGALFVPMLAVALLVLNGRAAWVGQQYRNSWLTVAMLAGTTLFFVLAAGLVVQGLLASAPAASAS